MIADPIDRQLDHVDGSIAPRRWVVLALAWAALTISTVCRLAWGSVAIPVSQSLDLPFAMLGTFVTAFYFGYVASNVVGGMVTDAFGGRIALTVSLASLAVVTFGFGYTQSLTVV
ncbi:hypothetical protein H8B02_04555 [Bradyrhizobium sp. Pear77]|uniref:hypothetical protein n=1 Tax=Bradyrhizobium altum TaxID=1571202 RepID=UPI001E575518|nr:hypothetical protein [Bradyrhizobium altum]MCC8952763.1 hypothetical protein [Bradyrhizobium altum]